MRLGLVVALLTCAGFPAGAGAPGDEAMAALEAGFAGTVRPFVATYCVGCHGKEKPEGDLDLSAFASASAAAADLPRWELVLDQLEARAMPPAKVKRRPTAEEGRGVVDWVRSVRKALAARDAGDPGVVPARRLSNSEYDYTIRDLTGVDLRPTREFPVDAANEAGFDNSGESLAMSPALVKKYLEAARGVAEHLVFGPEGLGFAPRALKVAPCEGYEPCIPEVFDVPAVG